MVLTGVKKINPEDLRTYTKQIHAYDRYVYAEIVYNDPDTERHFMSGHPMWIVCNSKRFGSFWSSKPTEQDFIDAHAWCDEQLELLNKYGTVKVTWCKMVHENLSIK